VVVGQEIPVMGWSVGGLARLSMGTGLCHTRDELAVVAVLTVLVELAEAPLVSPKTRPETDATTTSTARVAVRKVLVCRLIEDRRGPRPSGPRGGVS
jgi:hypothetical protein